jgi:hypothetical protein
MPHHILLRWILQNDGLHQGRGELPSSRDYTLSKLKLQRQFALHSEHFLSLSLSPIHKHSDTFVHKPDYATECGNRLSAWVSLDFLLSLKGYVFEILSSLRELTSKTVCNDIKDALKEGQEKHFEILYYRKDGESFNECYFVIASDFPV